MMVPNTLHTQGTRILAKSLFKELRGNGYSANHILGFMNELMDLISEDLRDARAAPAPGAAPSGEAPAN